MQITLHPTAAAAATAAHTSSTSGSARNEGRHRQDGPAAGCWPCLRLALALTSLHLVIYQWGALCGRARLHDIIRNPSKWSIEIADNRTSMIPVPIRIFAVGLPIFCMLLYQQTNARYSRLMLDTRVQWDMAKAYIPYWAALISGAGTNGCAEKHAKWKR